MSASIAVFGCVDDISNIFVLCQLQLKVQVCMLIVIIRTWFYNDFHCGYFIYLTIMKTLHEDFQCHFMLTLSCYLLSCMSSLETLVSTLCITKTPLWRLPFHFILTLADVDFLTFYVNLHVTFRNSRMYPRYTIQPYKSHK